MTTPSTGVGSAIGSGQINNVITSLAVNLRNLMQQVANLNLLVNGQGAGLAYLTSIGYSNEAGTSDPGNPGGITDAAYALQTIGYLNTVASVYFGTATQGTDFNFNQELSAVWAGQVAG